MTYLIVIYENSFKKCILIMNGLDINTDMPKALVKTGDSVQNLVKNGSFLRKLWPF